MLKIFFSMILFNLGILNISGIYDYSFTSIEGNNIAMSNYQQKKIIITTLPIIPNEENNKHLARLDSLSRAHQKGIIMIGVPSFEDGYTEQNSVTLRNWYRSILGNQFIISQGMYTHKSSSGQNPMFSWLTNSNLNNRFDMDVEGIGHQFYISENGNLYGVIEPEGKWSNNLFNRLTQ